MSMPIVTRWLEIADSATADGEQAPYCKCNARCCDVKPLPHAATPHHVTLLLSLLRR